MIDMVLIEKTKGAFDDPLRTLALVDMEERFMFGDDYFYNKICWSTEGGYWGADWRERMKALKRKE